MVELIPYFLLWITLVYKLLGGNFKVFVTCYTNLGIYIIASHGGLGNRGTSVNSTLPKVVG